MQASPTGLMQQQWNPEYGGGHLQDSRLTPLQQVMSPASDPHPFMQAAEFLDMQNSSDNRLSPYLSYPACQVSLFCRNLSFGISIPCILMGLSFNHRPLHLEAACVRLILSEIKCR